MRRVLLISLTVLPLASPVYAAACPMPDEIREEAVTRSFTQERHIEGMSRPLKSEGVLRAEDGRIAWHMLKPFDVETVITTKGITEAVDGGAPQPVSAAPANMGAGIARAAAALMRGQWSELETIFDVSPPVLLENGDWEIMLTPLQERMKAVLGTISVRGCEDVARVEIGGEGGDRQVIEFAPADVAP